MHGVLLTARPELEVNRRLVTAGRRLGLELEVVDGSRAVASLGEGLPRVLGVPPPRVALARVGNWRPESLLAALEALLGAGTHTPNPPDAIRTGRDHWRTLRALAAAGVPVPETLAGAEPEILAAAAAERLGFPVVVKQRRSRMGVGVIRCDRRDHLEAVLDSLWRVGDEVVVQRWVASGGVSHRLLVVGGRVAAAMRLEAVRGEWRSNAARGGRARALEPAPAEVALARRAAAALGLGICGVDILPAEDGPVVVEVNPSPGFLHLEEATGADVASVIAEELVRCAEGAGAVPETPEA